VPEEELDLVQFTAGEVTQPGTRAFDSDDRALPRVQGAHQDQRPEHHERDLAEPIEQRIKRLRSRTAGHDSRRSSATV